MTVCIIFLTGHGYAFDYQFGAEVFEGVFKEDNFTDESEAFFDYDATYNIFAVYPNAYINFNDNFNAYALAELEWFYAWDDPSADDKSDLDATLADLFLNYTGTDLTVDVGLVPFALGKGVVFYSDEPGVAIRYDGWRRTYIKGEMFRVFDHSPMATLTLGYVPGFLESVEFVGAWYQDADDKIAKLYQSVYEETEPASEGDLFWAGLQADFFVSDFYISGLMLQQFGSVEIDDGKTLTDYDVSAYLVDLELNYNLSNQFSSGIFFFAASGDTHPASGNLHAFMSPMPFNPRTAIFFNGGFERYDVEEAVVLGGVTWDGVMAPGVKFEYQPDFKFAAELAVAMLFPQGHLFDSDDWYGWEADMRVSYAFYQNHQVFVEAGILNHGNFFKKTVGFRPDSATRLVAGLSLVF